MYELLLEMFYPTNSQGRNGHPACYWDPDLEPSDDLCETCETTFSSPADSALSIAKGDGSVLLVEDNYDLRLTMETILELSGIRTHTARHGGAALEHLAAKPASLVITDLMMPVMNGWDLCAALREDARYAQIPVIVVSALPHSRTRAAELGVLAALQKPVDMPHLLRLVHRVLEPRDDQSVRAA